MSLLTEFTHIRFNQLKNFLHHQVWAGEVWQPRCYTGDIHWQSPRH